MNLKAQIVVIIFTLAEIVLIAMLPVMMNADKDVPEQEFQVPMPDLSTSIFEQQNNTYTANADLSEYVYYPRIDCTVDVFSSHDFMTAKVGNGVFQQITNDTVIYISRVEKGNSLFDVVDDELAPVIYADTFNKMDPSSTLQGIEDATLDKMDSFVKELVGQASGYYNGFYSVYLCMEYSNGVTPYYLCGYLVTIDNYDDQLFVGCVIPQNGNLNTGLSVSSALYMSIRKNAHEKVKLSADEVEAYQEFAGEKDTQDDNEPTTDVTVVGGGVGDRTEGYDSDTEDNSTNSLGEELENPTQSPAEFTESESG